MRIFRQGPGPYALPLAVIGLRLGQRLLDVGAGEARLFAELAAKAGLTGQANAVVASAADAERVKAAAAKAGVLVEVEVVSGRALPYPEGAFDVAVLDDTAGFLAAKADDAREALAAETLRVLRGGGRAVLVEHTGSGLLSKLKGRLEPGARLAEGGASALLSAARFHPVRLLAERDGYRFTEGWRPGSPVAAGS